MKYLVITLLTLTFFACDGQQKNENDNDNEKKEEKTTESQGAEEKAMAALTSKYGDTGDVKWEMDDKGNLEGHFDHDGDKLRADFTPDGSWIETEKSVDWDDLPEVVQDAIKSEFDKDDITEIEFVEHHSKGEFYDVEFKDPGKNVDVEYNKEGKKIN